MGSNQNRGDVIMDDLNRFLMFFLVMVVPAFFISALIIFIGNTSSYLISKLITINQIPSYFKIVKCVCLFLGQCLGVWFFWSGFGIGMVASNNESSWVMTYAYTSLWITMPVVAISYFLPLIGGAALIGNSIYAFYLLNQIWLNPISIGEKIQIFLTRNDLYNLLLTQISVSGPLLLIGITFLSIGLFEWIKFGSKKNK